MMQLITLVVLALTVSVSLSCPCTLTTDQKLAAADFNINALVVNETKVLKNKDFEYLYRIEILGQEQKWNTRGKFVSKCHMLIPVETSVCGAKLVKGQKYMLAGKFRDVAKDKTMAMAEMFLGACRIAEEIKATKTII